MEIKVVKKFDKTSPDKIRLITNLVKGWQVIEAVSYLKFINKAAAKPVIELLKSSLSAAKNKDLIEEDLKIKNIYANEGPRLKRRRIIHKGRATAIAKRMSHIILIISDNKNTDSIEEKVEKPKKERSIRGPKS